MQASTDVTLRNVTLKAGKGHRGADGDVPSPNYSGDAHAGGDANGTSGGNACENTCANKPSAVSSRGGKGGSVIAADSGADAGGPEPGEDGTPDLGATDGVDGKGGTVGPNCNAHTGASAPPANGGTGARVYGILTTSGWTPADGNAGETGKPGQGGGGGAAAKTPSPGGGGGGGCGGCGGTGGTAGKGGGSSFALLSLTSTITLEACTLSAAEAGAGGNGAAGQDGQLGGMAGSTGLADCSGGNGGDGGAGGIGGGGAGGLSVGVAYKGCAPPSSAALRPCLPPPHEEAEAVWPATLARNRTQAPTPRASTVCHFRSCPSTPRTETSKVRRYIDPERAKARSGEESRVTSDSIHVSCQPRRAEAWPPYEAPKSRKKDLTP